MKKNQLTVIILGLLFISVLFNFLAIGDRAKLKGNIDEFEKSDKHYFNYVNAQADLNNALFLYCQNQKDINVSTLNNDNDSLMKEIEEMEVAIESVNKTTEKLDQVRQDRQDFINSAKYIQKVEMPYPRTVELPTE